MEARLVKQEMIRFLTSQNPEVLCITGAWGVGKTYTWIKVLEEAKKEKTIPLKKHSYISLFGLNSLDDVKSSIVSNLEAFQSENKHWLQENLDSASNALARKYNEFSKVGKGAGMIGNLVGNSSVFLFELVRDQLICIDDLERRGSTLEIKDILGLASFLKEQRNCKIVFLVNDSELDDKEAFDKHLEKVVDVELTFAPSSKDAANIAIDNDDPISQSIKEYCIRLEISNIRVIKKIERYVQNLHEHIADFDERISQQVVHSITLFVWSKFQSGVAPSLEYIKNIQKRRIDRMMGNDDKKEEIDPKEIEWDATLDSYKFTAIDELDESLLEGVERGFFDTDKIKETATTLNHNMNRTDNYNSLETAWKQYNGSFQSNQKQIIDDIFNAANEAIQMISASQLDITVQLFKTLGKPNKAKDLLSIYLDKKKGDYSFWNLEDSHFSSEVKDDDVKQAFSDKARTFQLAIEVEDIFLKMAEDRGWNEEKVQRVADMPVLGYIEMFKKYTNPELSNLIYFGLRFERTVNASQAMVDICEKTKEALKHIGQESALNAQRVRNYGVEI